MKPNLFLFLFLFSVVTYAQEISGRVADEKGNPLPYATVQLLKSDSSIQKIETSNANGFFLFKNLEKKKYFLSVSFVGYSTFSKAIDLSGGNVQLGTLQLDLQATQLKTVTINEEKPTIQIEPDKTIFNVNKTISTAGDNGVELLRKAPGLQIDNDDNIILEGKAGVAIYINGKQSFLQGDDLKSYLKSLSADEIESVEIITQPSSKYDAAGNSGIINIVLKREKGLGTKGSISNTFTYGDFARNNTTLSLNHRSKKYAIFSSYNHFQGKATNFFNLRRIQGINVFDGKTDFTTDMRNDQLSLGGEYFVSSNSTISANVSGNLDDRNNSSRSNTLISQTDDFVTDSILKAPNRDENNVWNLSSTVNYTYKDSSGSTFSIDLDYVNYQSDRNSYQPNIYVSPDGLLLNENINFQETPIEINVYSANSDYEQKWGKGVVALGSKVSYVATHNVFDFYEVTDGKQLLNESRSNVFDYEETIAAAYVNYKYSKDKVKLQGGVRAEQTFSKGDLQSVSTVTNQEVERRYLNWFPSAGITYDVNANNSMALIYSRRIQRPNYQNLNPFETQINELSFRKGNPFLQPQFTHNIKLSNTYKYTLNTSFTFSYTSDYFAEVTEAEGERRSFINTRNVADQAVYNLGISYPKKINKWWSIYGSGYAYYTKFTANNPAFIPIDRFVYGGYGQSTFSLPKNFKAEISGWYSSPSIWRGTFKTKSLGALNLAIQKNLAQWSAKLSFNDIFYTIPWRANNRFGDLTINGRGGNDSRSVSFYLSYAFGHKDVKEVKKRNAGSESEQNRIEN